MGGCRNCADHQHTAECSTVAGALEACQMLCNFTTANAWASTFTAWSSVQPMGRCCPLGQMPSFPGVADASTSSSTPRVRRARRRRRRRTAAVAAAHGNLHGDARACATRKALCTSFNFQTTSDRCDQLAVSLGLARLLTRRRRRCRRPGCRSSPAAAVDAAVAELGGAPAGPAHRRHPARCACPPSTLLPA